MKGLNIPVILKPMDLGEYAEGMRGTVVQVWVNPSRAFLNERDEVMNEWARKMRAKDPDLNEWIEQAAEGRMVEWFCKLWSQGPEETRLGREEVEAIRDQDPALYQWLTRQTMEMLDGHRAGQKKA